jgi:small subunit ribosomal protein S5
MARNQNQQQQQAPKAREENELVDKLVGINRVAKVVKGGRRFAFSAMVVVGDQRGRVGYGTGKAREVPEAIRKSIEKAKRNMFSVPIVNTTVPHEIIGNFDSASVILKPASLGTGIVAGGPVRSVLVAAGYNNILTKSLGSNNATNVVWATLEGLRQLETVEQIAAKRGLEVSQVL